MAAGAFAVGLGIYLVHATRISEPPLLVPGADSTADAAADDDLAAASTVAGAFVAAMGAGRYRDAHALMADGYRARHSADDLRAAWASSPLLASPHAVRLSSARATSVQLPGGHFAPAATFTARGALVVAAGALDVSFTFLRTANAPRILTVAVSGVPILDGLH